MKLLVVAVGKVKGPLAPVVAEYERRAARYWKLAVEEGVSWTCFQAVFF